MHLQTMMRFELEQARYICIREDARGAEYT